MALTITPGSASADSYASLADAAAYATARGLTFAIAGADEALAEQALRRATSWIDGEFLDRFPGDAANVDQALEWPRSDVTFRGETLAEDEIPIQIARATIEAAVREKATPGSLSPDIVPGRIKKAASVGSISVEYAIGHGYRDQKPIVDVIEGILAPLLGTRPGNTVTRLVQRA